LSAIQIVETMSFDKTIQAIDKDKFNSIEIVKKLKMFPKCKTWMNIIFYKMISMLVMCFALKIYFLKME
jgi:hypothetical protein